MSDDFIPPVVSPPLSPVPGPTEQQLRAWSMWCHLSALAGLVVPFGNFLGPLIIWQIKKNEMPALDPHGRAALNFQLTIFIASLICGALMFLLWFICLGWIFIPVMAALWLAGIIFAILAGIKANDGKEYNYPFSFKFF